VEDFENYEGEHIICDSTNGGPDPDCPRTPIIQPPTINDSGTIPVGTIIKMNCTVTNRDTSSLTVKGWIGGCDDENNCKATNTWKGGLTNNDMLPGSQTNEYYLNYQVSPLLMGKYLSGACNASNSEGWGIPGESYPFKPLAKVSEEPYIDWAPDIISEHFNDSVIPGKKLTYNVTIIHVNNLINVTIWILNTSKDNQCNYNPITKTFTCTDNVNEYYTWGITSTTPKATSPNPNNYKERTTVDGITNTTYEIRISIPDNAKNKEGVLAYVYVRDDQGLEDKGQRIYEQKEICNNGEDDDQDGLIDCADDDCLLTSTNQVECTGTPQNNSAYCNSVTGDCSSVDGVFGSGSWCDLNNCSRYDTILGENVFYYCNYGREEDNSQGFCCPTGEYATYDPIQGVWSCQSSAPCYDPADPTKEACEFMYENEFDSWITNVTDDFTTARKWCVAPLDGRACCQVMWYGSFGYWSDRSGNVKIY